MTKLTIDTWKLVAAGCIWGNVRILHLLVPSVAQLWATPTQSCLKRSCHWLPLVAGGCCWLPLVAVGCCWLTFIDIVCHWSLLVAVGCHCTLVIPHQCNLEIVKRINKEKDIEWWYADVRKKTKPWTYCYI